jgi:RNA methyltransferase, TrmH family
MVGANRIKAVKSLQNKKNRLETGLFIVEGEKAVVELIQSGMELESLYVTGAFALKYKELLIDLDTNLLSASVDELAKMGTYQQNDMALAVVLMPSHQLIPVDKGLHLVLDGINDPGNLGTLIRLADWYGFEQVICSADTVDCFNPKVVAASKGSFIRIPVVYGDLKSVLANCSIPVIGAVMEGKNAHQQPSFQHGCLVIGNESHGIRPDLLPYLSHPVTIPRFGQADSLNAAMAGAILMDILRRPKI